MSGPSKTRRFKLGFLIRAPRGHGRPGDGARRCHDVLIELFVAAEALGFDGGWIAQHHFGAGGIAAPLVALAAIARRTSRIQLATAVTVVPLEDPVRLAEDAAVLDALSGGRVQLGLGSEGAGQAAYAAFGETWDDRARRLRTDQRILQALLRGAAPAGVEPLALHPPAPSLADRLWHAPDDRDGAVFAAGQGDGLLLGIAAQDPETQQKPLAEAYLRAWPNAKGAARIGVVRDIFPAGDRSVDNIVAGLRADPALFPYADYFIAVVPSDGAELGLCIRRLEVIATQIAPAFGWTRADRRNRAAAV